MYLTPNASFENLDASENNPGYTKEALDSDRFITPGWNVWLKVTATVDSFTMTIDGITTTTFSTVYEGFSQLAITPATPYVNIDNGVSAFVDDLVAKLGLSAGDISALWAWDAVDNEWHSWVYGTPLFLNSLPTITSGMAIYITNDTATENNYITKHESSFLISTQSAELEAYNSVSSYNAATYFSTSDGSNVLTITHTAHGAFVGGYVTLSGYTPPASPGNAAVNTKYAIKAILDEDTYEVTLPYEATTDTITSSGTLSYTYPPSLKVADIVTDGSGDISTLTTTASNNPLV